MEFDLKEHQQMIKETARDFAEKELKPLAGKLDEEASFPTENVKKLGELGFMGMMVPEEFGGAGLDSVSYAIAVEEISRGCASTGVIMSVNNSLVCQPILEWATPEQKKKFLPDLARGKKLGAFSLTEPEAGSDAGNLQTTAVLSGDNYVINGTKIFVTSGGKADVVLLFASTDKTLKAKGLTAFLIEKGMPGFKIGKKENKMGIRASETAELVFEDCKVPKANVLGQPGQGFKIAMKTLDGGRIGIAAQAVGIAQACLEAAVKYSKERKQFGKPICEFQAIQWMLANMAVEVDAARFLTLRAAYTKDKGISYSKEAAMAKLFASETAVKSAINAVQVHGGYGYMKEYDVERYFRDAKITEIYEGTSEVQRLVIAASLLKA
ncbi:MAG TPA: acyl-CoA dehydrogenase [bacterium]|nr:acyl-CoA dehydrogenase [bacterium]